MILVINSLTTFLVISKIFILNKLTRTLLFSTHHVKLQHNLIIKTNGIATS